MSQTIQMCRGFTDEQWKGLQPGLRAGDEPAWSCALEVFERRMKERYFSCIESLISADSEKDVEVPAGAAADCSTLPDDGDALVCVPGFAIMGLCCLLAETLQGFREKPTQEVPTKGPCTYPDGQCIRPVTSTTTSQFWEFLQRPAFRGEFVDQKMAKDFVDGIRNGILHEAETRRWIIWRSDPPNQIVARLGNRYVLNRAEFYKALKAEYYDYLRELRKPSSATLRERFVKKMNDIVKGS